MVEQGFFRLIKIALRVIVGDKTLIAPKEMYFCPINLAFERLLREQTIGFERRSATAENSEEASARADGFICFLGEVVSKGEGEGFAVWESG